MFWSSRVRLGDDQKVSLHAVGVSLVVSVRTVMCASGVWYLTPAPLAQLREDRGHELVGQWTAIAVVLLEVAVDDVVRLVEVVDDLARG